MINEEISPDKTRIAIYGYGTIHLVASGYDKTFCGLNEKDLNQSSDINDNIRKRIYDEAINDVIKILKDTDDWIAYDYLDDFSIETSITLLENKLNELKELEKQ